MDDHALLKGLVSKDQAAIRALVDTFQQKVFNTVLSMVQNREDAEELSQDVFLEVIASAASFRFESSLGTWIYRISINKSLDFLRKKKRKKRLAFFLSLVNDSNQLTHDIPDFVHPGVILEKKEEARYFFKAVDHLPEKQKAAVILFHIEGLSYRDVSEVMKQANPRLSHFWSGQSKIYAGPSEIILRPIAGNSRIYRLTNMN